MPTILVNWNSHTSFLVCNWDVPKYDPDLTFKADNTELDLCSLYIYLDWDKETQMQYTFERQES